MVRTTRGSLKSAKALGAGTGDLHGSHGSGGSLEWGEWQEVGGR